MSNKKLIVAPLLGLAVLAGAWALWPSEASAPTADSPREAGARRARTASDAERPDENGSPPGTAGSEARADELQAARDAIMDALHDQLDALDAEVGIDDTQRDRLETVLTEERTRGFETLDVLRRGPTPGQPPPDGKAIAEAMQASRTQADTEARATLDDTQYAAWLRLREPSPRR